MIDNRKIMAGNYLPAYRIHGNHVDSVGDVELRFRGAVRSSCYENFRDDQFCFQSYKVVEEGIEAHKYSPPLWKKNITTNESSPLLPSDHKYSNRSVPTRLQAIVEARKELMETIRSMPEDSYELSLKDLVDHEQQTSREEKKEDSAVMKDERISFRIENEDQIKNYEKNRMKKKKQKSIQSSGGQISRSTSMDSGTFLIKIFFPSFLGSKRKSTKANGCSKVSPRTSFEISEKEIHDDHKENWIKSIFVGGETISNGKNCSSNSNRPVVTHYFSSGCWPFSHNWKTKVTRQRGCLF